MIFGRHNVVADYIQAADSRNNELACSILCQSIGRLIITDPFRVKQLLIDYGVDANDMSNRRMAKDVFRKAKQYKAFREDLSRLLLDRELSNVAGSFSNAAGPGDYELGRIIRKDRGKSTISKFNEGMEKYLSADGAMDNYMEGYDMQRSLLVGDTGMHPALKWTLILGLVAGASYIGYRIWKNYRKKNG